MSTQYLGNIGSPSGASLIVKSISDSLENQKQQKLAVLQSLIQSGAYAPVLGGKQPGPIASMGQSLFGPTLGGPTTNVGGQNFQFNPNAMNLDRQKTQSEINKNNTYTDWLKNKPQTSVPLSPENAVAQYKAAQEAAKKAGLTGVNIGQSATGRTTITPESGFQQRTSIAQQTAPKIFDMLKKGNFNAYKNADPMAKDLVGKMASDANIDLDKVQANYITGMRLAGTAGSPQILRFTSAENSLNQSLNALDDLSNKYDRSNFMPTLSNKLKIVYDKETDPQGNTFQKPRFELKDTENLQLTQQQMAIKYLTQINQAKDLLATVYQGGYTPHEQAFQLAIESLNPLNGPKGQRAAIDQIRVDMAIRRQGMEDALMGKTTNEQHVIDANTGNDMTESDGETEQYQEGQTATNPQTKEKLIFKGGQWQPMQ